MTALREMLATGVTTVARAWVLSRKDGLMLGFTDHDRPLVVEGVRCRASAGMSARALETGSGLAVDNSEAAGVLSDDAISEADLRAGRWDGAEVVVRLVDWSDPSSTEILFRGSLGEVSYGGGAFQVELRGLTDALNAPRGRVYHSRCDAVLGDGRCAVDLDAPGRAAEVVISSASEARVLEVIGAEEAAAGWFVRGRAELLDGAAIGLTDRIKIDVPIPGGRRIELWEPLGAAPAIGDRLRIEAGCDKAMATCRDKFANLLNFRGFPHIPGDDWLMASPARRAG
ncbi:DUF2163 domain-containing protein [Jannaschia sp. Os4]|uniref:DUF2163 domain-containing protein n=1 Tax=Jannaschia sp. Os4 TaxID=2807617 RepID=UPI00193A75D6|nr:DUF2163 domain-containing protein [Jannaschia sp. Os4]MBM2576808.1 DUF2163 domain-containing protein [Jannaschia sp. Os4]